ncbi:MAG: hypothetical protein R3C61_18345 [Bacteroidia bacterium]
MGISESKLWITLRSLDFHSRSRFLRYVASPYHNSDTRQTTLLAALINSLPEAPERETMDALLFPGLPFDYFRISNLLSDLMKLLEGFLVADYIRDQPFLQDYALLVSARENGLDKLYTSVEKRMEKKLEKTSPFTPQAFYQNYTLEEERNIFSVSRTQRQENSRLDEKIGALHLFYISSMLKNVCERLNQENIIQSQTRPEAVEAFIGFINEHYHKYENEPFIRIYYRILLTLTHPEEISHFYELMELLGQYGETMDREELKPMYQFAQNYCIRQSNRGRTEFLDALMNVFIRMIDLGLIYHNGWISPWDFKNIVALGVRLKKFEWTDDFIERFSLRLEPFFRENALIFNRAQLHYGREEYRPAMRLLVQVEAEDVYYSLGAKTILMKIYYELEESEALYSLLHTFSESLRRNKTISGYQRTVHLNLIRFVRMMQLVRERMLYESGKAINARLERLRQKIESEEALTQSDWLKSRLEELKNAVLK